MTKCDREGQNWPKIAGRTLWTAPVYWCRFHSRPISPMPDRRVCGQKEKKEWSITRHPWVPEAWRERKTFPVRNRCSSSQDEALGRYGETARNTISPH